MSGTQDCKSCGKLTGFADGVCETCKRSGYKVDHGKTRLGLVDPFFIEATGRVATFGAKKYAPWNWKNGMDWSRMYDALLRHLNAWNDGEDLDAETGFNHLWHAACELMFLAVHVERKLGKDDRWKVSEAPPAAPSFDALHKMFRHERASQPTAPVATVGYTEYVGRRSCRDDAQHCEDPKCPICPPDPRAQVP